LFEEGPEGVDKVGGGGKEGQEEDHQQPGHSGECSLSYLVGLRFLWDGPI
jgi:hypothetical protein